MEKERGVTRTYHNGYYCEYVGGPRQIHGGRFYPLMILDDGHRRGQIIWTQEKPQNRSAVKWLAHD